MQNTKIKMEEFISSISPISKKKMAEIFILSPGAKESLKNLCIQVMNDVDNGNLDTGWCYSQTMPYRWAIDFSWREALKESFYINMNLANDETDEINLFNQHCQRIQFLLYR